MLWRKLTPDVFLTFKTHTFLRADGLALFVHLGCTLRSVTKHDSTFLMCEDKKGDNKKMAHHINQQPDTKKDNIR